MSTNPSSVLHQSAQKTSFVDSVSILENLDDRLRHVENDLSRQLSKLVKQSRPRKVLYFELDLSVDEYSWLTSELAMYFSSGRSVDELIKKCPRIIIGALVSAAMQSTREGTVWPTFWELVGVEPQDEFERRIRAGIRRMLSLLSLNSFEDVDLGANEYVSLFLLHAGITSSQIVDIVRFAEKRGWHANDAEMEDRAVALIAAIQTSVVDRESLQEFVANEPEFARDLYTRVLELIAYLNNTQFDSISFEGTHGIPSLAFHLLVDMVENGRAVPVSSRQRHPSVVFIPESNSFAVEIPSIVTERVVDADCWEIEIEDLSGIRTSKSVPAVAGHEQSQWIVISEPFSRITVTLDGAESKTFEFMGITSKFPFLLVSSSNRLVSVGGGVRSAVYTLVGPVGTKAADQSGEDVTSSSIASHADWLGWNIREIDLERTRSVRFELPDRYPVIVPVGAARLFNWITDVPKLKHARGRDMQPIYTESPRVQVSGEVGDSWNLEIVYMPVDGEPEHVLDVEVEQTMPIEEWELFEADQFEDPWLGRFNVNLSRNGVMQDSMLFSIAEGLDLSASSDGPSTTPFRFQDGSNKFTPWSYSIRCKPQMKMSFPVGAQTLGDREAARREVFSTETGFELEVDVVPESLMIRTKKLGAAPAEDASVPTLEVENLDPDAAVVVRAPEALPCARFVLVASAGKSRKLFEIGQGSAHALARKTLRITNRAIDSGMGNLGGAKLVLIWSRLSRATYENSLGDRERRAYFKLRQDQRIEKYRAVADKALVSASIANLVRRPLVVAVEEKTGELLVQQPGQERDLLAWAWLLGDLDRAPIPLESTQSGFLLPPELNESGPFIVDFREGGFLVDTRPPRRPSKRAFTVIREGFPVSDDLDYQFPLYLLGEVSDIQLSENAILKLWRSLDVLQEAYERRGCDVVFQRVTRALQKSPRAAIDVWASQNLHRESLIPLLIQSGIVTKSIQTTDTLAVPNTDRTVSLLEEIADAAYLKVLEPDGEELAQSLQWVASQGSTSLWEVLTTGKDILTEAKSDVRRLALAEALRSNDQLLQLGTIASLYSTTRRLLDHLGCVGVDSSIIHTAAVLEQQALDDEGPSHSMSRYVPFISYVTNVASRMVANREWPLEKTIVLLQKTGPDLARVSECAPKIFELDLVTAEALSQSLHFAGH
ncbi:hypothetical protein [Corynebacterium sp. HMSC072A02]|uniref:hypothetical protein n=1 Tax=Corynebacterium sp. HMSC072A02 TaxID=1715177 RepID=UPI0008A167DA|nr:hypothetical protein [Corynebacterium sp. HMSC072A02]